jgi:quinoprotein glucose dehydrogenase
MANLRALLALAALTLLVPHLTAADAVNPNPSPLPPLEATRWTPPAVNIPDPVAISFDPLGRAYVSQTQRRKAQDLDIREHRDWVPVDISLQSVDEKRAFYHTELAPERSAQNATRSALKEDFNGDGSHDWHDLTVLSERIWLVQDSNDDGTADHASIFAQNFNTEVTGVAAGVLWHDHHVYATIAPDVWKLTDTTGDDKADQREIVATGFGVHIAYGGHDMHGLTVGPDGRIYWSIGDKALSVINKEGQTFHFPDQGAILRAEPDGSHFEVFARGLRNVQEFAFDDYGNMFGVDNDADNAGEKERFVYLVEGSDAGWRINWQLQKGDYNIWMREGLWQPWHEGQPAHIVPPIQNYLDGPSGFAYNPGTALSPEYRGYFFLSQFLFDSCQSFAQTGQGHTAVSGTGGGPQLFLVDQGNLNPGLL